MFMQHSVFLLTLKGIIFFISSLPVCFWFWDSFYFQQIKKKNRTSLHCCCDTDMTDYTFYFAALDIYCLNSLIHWYQHRHGKFTGGQIHSRWGVYICPRNVPYNVTNFLSVKGLSCKWTSSFFSICLHTKDSFWPSSPSTIPKSRPRKQPSQMPRAMAASLEVDIVQSSRAA